MNSSGNTDEFSVLEFQPPKIEYTRSQLMDLDTGRAFASNENASKMFESQLVRNSPRNAGILREKLVDKIGQNFIDDFWSRAKANNQTTAAAAGATAFPPMTPNEIFDFDYQAALVQAATDDRFGLPNLLDEAYGNRSNSKVDRWLNTGRNSSEYAHATSRAEPASPAETFNLKSAASSTIKADETSSTVSNHSAIRAKLLDKTAKVKQNLRKLTKQ